MRTPAVLLVPLFLPLFLVLATVARADEPPEPRLDRVDHRQPAALVALAETAGAGQRTQGVARQLAAKGADERGTLSQVVRWVGRNLRQDASKAATWRTVDQILVDGTAGGEADRALVIGAMARAAGIPVVWVKALSLAFLRQGGWRQGSFDASAGRTFLEVHLQGRWHLLDPETALLHGDYDPSVTRLPGDTVAFDKGGDPYALVLSNRLELWRAQVRAYAARKPLPPEPWTAGQDLLAPWRVWITGQGGPASYAREACKTLGFLVERTVSSGWTEALAEVRGKTLIVTVQDGAPNLPREHWAALLPPGSAEALSGARPAEKGWLAHRLADGTRVVLVLVTEFGPVELAVSEALEG
jgi:hypothetical protein